MPGAAPLGDAALLALWSRGMNRREIAQRYCVFLSVLFSAAAISSQDGARQTRAFGPLQGLAEEDLFSVVSRFHRRRIGSFNHTCVSGLGGFTPP